VGYFYTLSHAFPSAFRILESEETLKAFRGFFDPQAEAQHRTFGSVFFSPPSRAQYEQRHPRFF